MLFRSLIIGSFPQGTRFGCTKSFITASAGLAIENSSPFLPLTERWRIAFGGSFLLCGESARSRNWHGVRRTKGAGAAAGAARRQGTDRRRHGIRVSVHCAICGSRTELTTSSVPFRQHRATHALKLHRTNRILHQALDRIFPLLDLFRTSEALQIRFMQAPV